MRRRTLWARLATAVAAVVAAIATDAAVGRVSSFWAGRPLTASLAAGLLLLALGLFAVEALVDRRDERRGRVAAPVALAELAFNADELRRGMLMLLTGDYGSHFDVPFDAQKRAQLVRILARHPELEEAEDDEGRLRLLLGDREWTRLAVEGLDELTHRHRRALALWLPALTASERLAAPAAGVAAANELLGALQEPLGVLAQRRVRPEAPTEAVVTLWRATTLALVGLQERLLRAAARGRRRDEAPEPPEPETVQAPEAGAAATSV